MLTDERLAHRLAPRPFRFFERAGSTQDAAQEWLRQGAPSGAVVIADEQLAGRGRRGRVWYTPPGVALALSVILRPEADALAQVTMAGALAVVDLVGRIGAQDVTIKWPNDVRWRGRKVSGILSDAAWQGDQLQGVVLGIGVNVRNDFTGTELFETATSIEIALGRVFDRSQLLEMLLACLDGWITRLGTPALYEGWAARLETIGQVVTVRDVPGSLRGIAESVDAQGALCVRDDAGVVHRIVAGDILPGTR